MAQREYIDSVNGKKIFAERAGYTKNGENLDEALTDLAANVKEIIAGDNISISSNATSTLITATISSGPAGACGPKGFCGPKGACGPQGSKGDTGFCGPQGSKGDTGFCGPQGSKGDTGICGPQGICGPSGAKGSCGPKGFCGPQGLCGPKGPCGPLGFCGPQGPCGPKGPCGPLGFCGPSGAKGNTGFCGPSGLTGICGPSGPCGPQGFCGPRGKIWRDWTFESSNLTSKTPTSSYTDTPWDTWSLSARAAIAIYKFWSSSTTEFVLGVQLKNNTDNTSMGMPFPIAQNKKEVTYVVFIQPYKSYTLYINKRSGTAAQINGSVTWVSFYE